MPRTALTPVVLPAPFAVAPLALPFVAADTANNNCFPHTGKQVLIAYNSDGAAAHTITVHSVGDSAGRTGDLTLSIPAASFVVTQEFPAQGWRQADGNIYVDAADATVKLAVITVP